MLSGIHFTQASINPEELEPGKRGKGALALLSSGVFELQTVK
jgi:hypothetical protein